MRGRRVGRGMRGRRAGRVIRKRRAIYVPFIMAK